MHPGIEHVRCLHYLFEKPVFYNHWFQEPERYSKIPTLHHQVLKILWGIQTQFENFSKFFMKGAVKYFVGVTVW